MQIPRYDKVQQEHSEILDLAAISNPIVNQEVYWPGVLGALRHVTPSGGSILTFSASADPPQAATVGTATHPAPAALSPAQTQIATVSISLATVAGYTYFRNWYYSVSGSGKLTVNGFSGLTKANTTNVTYSATIGVTGEITSIRERIQGASMNALKNLNFDLLKSKVVLIVTGGVVVLLLVWWFAWMTPEANKLASVQQQVASDQANVSQLNLELTTLKAEKKLVLKELPYLRLVTTAIPPTEDPPGIVDSLNNLANQTGCSLLTVTPSDEPTPTSTAGLSTIPVTLSVSGVHSNIFAFLSGFYSMKRLMTISSVSLGPSNAGNANILANGDGQLYTLSVSADAYTTYVTPTPTA